MKATFAYKMTYTTDFIISKDGTKIGYRQLGSGPGLVLVHGGMQASQSFMALGTLLADYFSVYIPDRKGRGLGGRRYHRVYFESNQIKSCNFNPLHDNQSV